MPYATQADIDDIHGADLLLAIADHNNDDAVDTQAVTDALTNASDLIDSYLRSKYSVPILVVPALINQFCIDIAIYNLSHTNGGMSEEYKERYKEATANLKRIADGIIVLDLPVAAVSATTGAASVSGPGRNFTRSKTTGIF